MQKKNRWLKRILFVLALSLYPTFAQSENVKEIILAFENVPYPPFYFSRGKGIRKENPGLFIDMIRQAAAKADATVTFKRMPWKRVLVSLANHEIDGAFSASYKTERDEYAEYPQLNGKLDPSRSLTDQTYVFYRLKNSDALKWDGKTLDVMNKPIIGTKNGYSIIDLLKTMGAKVDEVATTETNLAKVKVGRLAAYAGLERMVDPYLKANPRWQDTIEKVSPPIIKKPYFVIFNEPYFLNNQKTVEAFWDAIKDIRTSPEFLQMQNHYDSVK